MQVCDRRYPEVDSEAGAVMSLVRFGDPMGPLSQASLPFDRQGRPQQAPDVMVGAAFVSEIFTVSQGKIAEIHAYWIPSEGNVKTPWAVGTVAVRDWQELSICGYNLVQAFLDRVHSCFRVRGAAVV